MAIPVIDLQGLGDPGADRRIADDLLRAYGEWGFGYIAHTPIDPALLDAVFAQSQAFHALPMDEKLRIRVNAQHRGYIPFKASTDVNSSVETVTKPNLSESFMMLRECGPDDPDVLAGAYLAGPNQWLELPGFREALAAYDAAMGEVAARLIAVFDLALDARGALSAMFDPPTTWLRLLHYPPQDPQSPADEFGSAPHTDFGAITILAQDDVGGLSVKTSDGEWVDVPPMPGSFVLNVGDMLHRLSNGLLRSTPHRVTNRTGRERFSIPFFYDPNVRTVIEPLPSTVGDAHPAAFAPVVYGDWLRAELESSYDDHRAAAQAQADAAADAFTRG